MINNGYEKHNLTVSQTVCFITKKISECMSHSEKCIGIIQAEHKDFKKTVKSIVKTSNMEIGGWYTTEKELLDAIPKDEALMIIDCNLSIKDIIFFFMKYEKILNCFDFILVRLEKEHDESFLKHDGFMFLIYNFIYVNFFCNRNKKRGFDCVFEDSFNEEDNITDDRCLATLLDVENRKLANNNKAKNEDAEAANHILFDDKDFRMRHAQCFEKHEFNIVDHATRNFLKIYSILNEKTKMFQRTTDDIEAKLDNFLTLFPNITAKDALLIKNSVMFCHIYRHGIIKGIKPFLLVGSPGCGKTRFVTKFSSMILGQNFTEFVPCGASRGASYIMGSTPDYKSAEEGMLVRSIWTSNPGFLTINPLIVLDEIDKCSYNSDTDNNDLYGTLCTILSDQCSENFRDSFLDIAVHFFPFYFATANSLENIPDPIVDRFEVLKFKDLTNEDIMNTVIPQQYSELRRELYNMNTPETLSAEDIYMVYRLSNKKTRSIKLAIQQVLLSRYDANGNRNDASDSEIVYQFADEVNSDVESRIGFI